MNSVRLFVHRRGLTLERQNIYYIDLGATFGDQPALNDDLASNLFAPTYVHSIISLSGN